MATTLFLSVQSVRELVSKIGLGPFTRLLVERLEADFRRWPQFDKSPRAASHSPLGVIELMPTADQERYAFKYVNGHPANHLLGMPTVMAFGGLASVETGWPLMISEMTILTAIRTAATSALAARTLAQSGATSMTMIGTGAQSEFQVIAFREVLGIEVFRIFDIDSQAIERLRDNLTDDGFIFIPYHSVESAVPAGDIVTTATAAKSRAAVLTSGMVRPGQHINAIGGDCPGKTEIHPDVLRQARVFVEFAPQTRIEGDIQQMEPDFPVTELWEVLTDRQPGRQTAEDITVFDSVGFALEDFSTLSLVYDLAREHGLGETIDLVPKMNDVRNLYGLLRQGDSTR
jgi:ornithine cyclodeaminase